MFRGSTRSLQPASCTRRTPRQERGEHRVATLLAAARHEFSLRGYEAATMSSIARRAKAPIGSLYQFFPNKHAIAMALRTAQILDAESLWQGLEKHAASGDVEAFVARFVQAMMRFVDGHPAFLPLLEAPSSTLPVSARSRLRQQMERMLVSLQPRLGQGDAERTAEVVMNVNKAMMSLYARSRSQDRGWVAREYAATLGAYLASRLSPGTRPSRRPRARAQAATSGRRVPSTVTPKPQTRAAPASRRRAPRP